MNFNPQYIKSLIEQAHTLLAQDDVDEATKTAIADCLKTIYASDNMQQQQDETTTTKP